MMMMMICFKQKGFLVWMCEVDVDFRSLCDSDDVWAYGDGDFDFI